MDEALQAQIDTYLPHLDGLIQRGRQIRERLAADPSRSSVIAANRDWQQDCGVTINQLSGGSKAHWLARSFSEAFLMRSTSGQAIGGASAAELAGRLVEVLEQAASSLSGMRAAPAPTSATPLPSRFEFVHKPELRPVIEQAYSEGRDALEQSEFRPAFLNFCGILEAIVTDALEFKGRDESMPQGEITDWLFETRLSVAEKIGIIQGGCARLPSSARRYRELTDAELEAISERDARRTGQVLHVVMRDLNPGR